MKQVTISTSMTIFIPENADPKTYITDTLHIISLDLQRKYDNAILSPEFIINGIEDVEPENL